MGLLDAFHSQKKGPAPSTLPPNVKVSPKQQAADLVSMAQTFFLSGRSSGEKSLVRSGLDCATQALKLDPDCREALQYRIAALVFLSDEDNTNLVSALSSCEHAIRLNAKDPSMWYNKGVIFERLGKFQDAFDAYNRSWHCSPVVPTGYLGVARGRMLEKLDRDIEAQKTYEEVPARDPAYGTALEAFGVLMERQGKQEKALKAFWAASNIFHRRKNDNQALRCLDHVLRLTPTDPVALYRKATVLMNRYDRAKASDLLDEAEACIDAALAADAKTAAQLITVKGRCIVERGNPAEGLKFFDRALTLAPSDKEIYLQKGYAFQKLKRFDESLSSYDQVCRADPDNPLPWSMKATVRRDQEKYEDALKDIDESIRRFDRDPVTWKIRAELLTKLGRTEAAKEAQDAANSCKHGVYLEKEGIHFYYPGGGGSIVIKGFGLTKTDDNDVS